jgi:hypothetical protein
MKNIHEIAREAMGKHGISAAGLTAEMRRKGLCSGREEEMVNRLVVDGRCVLGVAVALFGIIGRQRLATIH